jgi:DNA mismatch endonuclease (patch repair protein)
VADVVDAATRSRMMSGIRGKDTKPELIIRKALHARGFRFRLHVKDLPGKPDLVLPKYGAVIFVHGCFWHGHGCDAGTNRPRSNLAYWRPKLLRNRRRDATNRRALKRLGWKVLVVWECQLGNLEQLRSRIERFLEA